MIDFENGNNGFNNELGQRTLQRIQTEQVICLTSVSPSGIPQPCPVWFVWDGTRFVIYSIAKAKKLTHIAHKLHVALHFNTNELGKDIQVILGIAQIDPTLPTAKNNSAYSAKYQTGILGLGMNEDQYAAPFRVAIRITPTRLRGLSPIPTE